MMRKVVATEGMAIEFFRTKTYRCPSELMLLARDYTALISESAEVVKTIDAYARAVRWISEHFDCCPDQLTLEQREVYFSDLVKSHYWSTIKIDRNGLQFFWKHVLKQDWQWVNIIKAPKVRSLPDILTIAKVEQLIGAGLKRRGSVDFPGFSTLLRKSFTDTVFPDTISLRFYHLGTSCRGCLGSAKPFP